MFIFQQISDSCKSKHASYKRNSRDLTFFVTIDLVDAETLICVGK
jgi:hypothetical protein